MKAQAVTEKVCSKCGKKKSLHEFCKNSDGKLGRRSQCKDCHKNKFSTFDNRARCLVSRGCLDPYGTPEGLRRLWDSQHSDTGHSSALSGLPLRLEDACIDHCHETGLIRGYISKRENSYLGFAEKLDQQIIWPVLPIFAYDYINDMPAQKFFKTLR